MLGEEWRGRVTDILDWMAEAGYAGIEITNSMIREFYDRPGEFAAELRKRNLELVCFAYATPTGFTDANLWDDYLAGARRAIEFVRHFPRPRLGLGGAAHPSREDARAGLDRAIKLYNEVGRMASSAGVSVNMHPHSHHGSLLETAEEYQYLLDHLEPRYVSFGPDTGHIVRGGQDLLTCLRTHLPRIKHLHLKDVNAKREWVALGEGLCDFPAVMKLLKSANYDGWVVAEEESAEARRDGAAAIRKNRAYLRSIGY
jgi:sugar phosphate isomerase/epimerase